MSEVIKENNVEHTASASQQKTLLSEENIDYQIELDDLKTYLVSEPNFKGVNMPRFGMFSIFGRSVPMYAYDHPALLEKFNTAFTDGQNIFYSVPFMEEILADERGGRNGMLFLTLHEIGHIMFRHFYRLSQYPHHIANRAQDMSMNTRMLRDFVHNPDEKMNSLSPMSEVLSKGIGFQSGDIEKYAHRSEEDIAREMMEEYENQKQQLKDALQKMKSGQSGGGGGQGTPMPGGQGDPGDPQDGDSEENGNGDPKTDGSDPSDKQGMGTDHLLSPEDFADILNEAGLGHVIDILKIPVDKDGNLDEAALAKQNERQITNAHNAHTQMTSLRQQTGGHAPGGHCESYLGETLGKLNKPKIQWKLATKEAIIGSGMRMVNTMDHPGDAYFIDPAQMGLAKPLYIGARVPGKSTGFTIALLDTSGSMNKEWMKESASEVLGIVANNKHLAPDVVFMQIDTVVRGGAQVITPQNVDQILKESFVAKGRGGTSLTQGIVMAMESPEVKKRLAKKEKINSLIYFTDLGDAPPQRKDLPDNLPKKVIYMAAPGTYNDHFAKGVSDYATVVSMGERMEVDLTGEKVTLNGSGRNTRKPK